MVLTTLPLSQDGVVKLWHAGSSWGFLKPATGNRDDVYVHADNVAGKNRLPVGQRVAFHTAPAYSGKGLMAVGCYPVSKHQISPLFELPRDAKVVLGKDLPNLRDHGCFLPICKTSNGGCIRPMGRYIFISICDSDAFSTPLRNADAESTKRLQEDQDVTPNKKLCSNPRFRSEDE